MENEHTETVTAEPETPAVAIPATAPAPATNAAEFRKWFREDADWILSEIQLRQAGLTTEEREIANP